MNTVTEYGSIRPTDVNDNRPPLVPRQAQFALSTVKICGCVAVLVLGLMTATQVTFNYDVFNLYQQNPQIAEWSFASSILKESLWSPLLSAISLCIPMFPGFLLLLQNLKRRRKLFTDGCAALATVTFIGIIRNPDSNKVCDVVKWAYNGNGFECTGVSPRGELQEVNVGDKFWVVYENENPWFVRRWELFDEDGNLKSNDRLSWKRE